MKTLSPNGKAKVVPDSETMKRSSSQYFDKKLNENTTNNFLKRQTSTPLIPPPPDNRDSTDNLNEDEIKMTLDIQQEEKVNFKSFKILKVLGSGAFGKVFMVIFFFIKIIE